MLARKQLVPLKKEFPRIRKEGKVYDSESFGLVVAYGSGNGPQASFIVSKKIDKRSVVRHDVKRKLSDSVTPLLSRLNGKVELVFLAKQKAISTGREELDREVGEVLKRARLVTQ